MMLKNVSIIILLIKLNLTHEMKYIIKFNKYCCFDTLMFLTKQKTKI